MRARKLRSSPKCTARSIQKSTSRAPAAWPSCRGCWSEERRPPRFGRALVKEPALGFDVEHAAVRLHGPLPARAAPRGHRRAHLSSWPRASDAVRLRVAKAANVARVHGRADRSAQTETTRRAGASWLHRRRIDQRLVRFGVEPRLSRSRACPPQRARAALRPRPAPRRATRTARGPARTRPLAAGAGERARTVALTAASTWRRATSRGARPQVVLRADRRDRRSPSGGAASARAARRSCAPQRAARG